MVNTYYTYPGTFVRYDPKTWRTMLVGGGFDVHRLSRKLLPCIRALILNRGIPYYLLVDIFNYFGILLDLTLVGRSHCFVRGCVP